MKRNARSFFRRRSDSEPVNNSAIPEPRGSNSNMQLAIEDRNLASAI